MVARHYRIGTPSLLEALGCTEKYVKAAHLDWEVGEAVTLTITYHPTDDDGNAMIDPADNSRVLEAAKRYKLVEIEAD